MGNQKEKPLALCGSLKCVGKDTMNAKSFAVKNVTFSTHACPDCKNMLLWKIMNKNRQISKFESKRSDLFKEFL